MGMQKNKFEDVIYDSQVAYSIRSSALGSMAVRGK